MSAPSPDVDAMVRARFTVKDTFQLPDGEVEYKVDYGPESREKFAELHRALSDAGLTPWLTGTGDQCVLAVKKKVPLTPTRSRIPVIIALFTIATVIVYALVERLSYEQFAPGIPGYLVFTESGMTILALLGARELGHRFMARYSKAPSNTSYLLPGIPGLTAILPTLGYVSSQRAPAVSRDKYFDMMISGPIVALAAAVVLQVVGDLSAHQAPAPPEVCTAVNSLISACPVNPSVIQAAIYSALGNVLTAVPNGYVRVSPIVDGATVGLLLVFIGLLPMASFDGGHISSLAWGTRSARVTTYLSVVFLIVIDTPFYWGIAIAVLLLAGRPVQPHLLDERSALSDSRRLLYFVAIVVAFLCVPIPQNLATFPLG